MAVLFPVSTQSESVTAAALTTMATMPLRLHPISILNNRPFALRPPFLPALRLPSPALRLSSCPRFPLALRLPALTSLGFIPHAAVESNGDGEESTADNDFRGQSTMPDRFRPLTKEAPDRPLRWPWIIAVALLVYSWRTVLWELSNWMKATFAIYGFLLYLLKLAFAIMYQFIGGSITNLITCIEFVLFFLRSTYLNIVAFSPTQEFTRIILFTSAVLAIAETTVPDSVDSQPYLLTLSGLVAFGAVRGFIPELLFWLFLASMFCYSHFIKKRDGVSAALPTVAVFTAVGEPWIRALATGSYLTLAIVQHSRSLKEKAETDIPARGRRLPLPLMLVALAVGINIAAKCIRHRHLTWMIV